MAVAETQTQTLQPTNVADPNVTATYGEKPPRKLPGRNPVAQFGCLIQGLSMLPPPMSDLERSLLRRLRDRDERAFRELIEDHRDRVFNITLRMLGQSRRGRGRRPRGLHHGVQDDRDVPRDSKFSTWLYRVAVNHCKNRIKYLARRHDRDRDELDESVERTNGAIGAPAARSRPIARSRACRWRSCSRRRSPSSTTISASSWSCATSRTCRSRRSARSPELPDGTVKSRLHRARARAAQEAASVM